MEIEKRKGRIINTVYFVMILGAFYLFMKYAFWLCLPILFALLMAVVLQRPAEFLARKTPLKKGLTSVICVLLVIAIIALIISLIGMSAWNYLMSFVDYIKGIFKNSENLVTSLEQWSLNVVHKLPAVVSGFLEKNITEIFANFSTSVSEQTANTSGAVSAGSGFDFSKVLGSLSGVFSTAKQIPSVLLSVVIAIIMSCFMTADYSYISNFIKSQLSEKKRRNLTRAKHLLRTSFRKIVKAYILIILITFVEMFVGLYVLKLIGIFKSQYIVMIAAITAVVDILPVLGTGTIIWPWAAYSLIVGHYGMAIGLVVIYVLISVIRQIIEPKLVAGQLGLPPFITIIGMYIGLKLFSVVGMMMMPILFIMIKLLNDEGIIRLWKPVDDDGNLIVPPEGKDEQPEEVTAGEEKVTAEVAE